jgi:hypothetical protein
LPREIDRKRERERESCLWANLKFEIASYCKIRLFCQTCELAVMPFKVLMQNKNPHHKMSFFVLISYTSSSGWPDWANFYNLAPSYIFTQLRRFKTCFVVLVAIGCRCFPFLIFWYLGYSLGHISRNWAFLNLLSLWSLHRYRIYLDYSSAQCPAWHWWTGVVSLPLSVALI